MSARLAAAPGGACRPPARASEGLVETALNFPCRDLFSRTGFTAAGGGLWRLPDKVTPAVPAHVRIAPVEPARPV